jgi:hypothetical protein
MRLGPLARVVACFALLACEPGFDPPSKVKQLRVLAVRSEPASGSPGATVDLEMLVADGKSTPGEPERPLEMAWFLGCHNPPSRLYYACVPAFRALAQSTSSLSELPPGAIAFGPQASLVVPDDILSSAPRIPTDPVHFGVSYSFFAVCAGRLEVRPDIVDGLPLGCVHPESGRSVGPSDFVVGFSTLYTYENAENTNPELESLEFDGTPVLCDDDDPSCLPTVPACTLPDRGACPTYRIDPRVVRESVEAVSGGGEILWASYYATAGEVTKGTQLVSDRVTGMVADYSSAFVAPARGGRVRLWVTVNDNRGGAVWSSFDVMVE